MEITNNGIIENKLKLLPPDSGVYIMLDVNNKIIYIGKAKNLRNRVKQYFNGTIKNEKTYKLVSQINDFEYIITPTELDALLLENNLIKLHQPHYNILLKDDKTFPYIKINIEEKYPSIEIVRRIKKDGKYFGPYLLGVSAQKLIDLIHFAFPIRSCKNKRPKGKKVCLEYHMDRCLGPCVKDVDENEYQNIIKNIIKLLDGDVGDIKNTLTSKMQSAVEKEEFELAIQYRDYLSILENIGRKTAVSFSVSMNVDVFTFEKLEEYGTINILMIRAGNLVGSINKPIKEAGEQEDILSTYIMQYYDINPVVADEILLAQDFDFVQEIQKVLSNKKGKKVNILVPRRGDKKRLVDMSVTNAREYLNKSLVQIKNTEKRTEGALNLLGEILGINEYIKRIECFDISNISGTNKVASMAVFINGEPFKKHYRMFKIKTVEGTDDYASLREVLVRRLSEFNSDDDSFKSRPDLIIIDGGKGQLSAVTEIINSYNINHISLAEKEEHIFVPGQKEPIKLDYDNYALQLCQRIRDEAHRFAVGYHRSLRDDSMLKSNLRKIKGIGNKKAIALLTHFKTHSNIANATLDELLSIKGISKIDAENILSFYSNENQISKI